MRILPRLSATLLVSLVACASEPDAARFARALQQPAAPALRTCRGIATQAVRDECVATVVRDHDELDGVACQLIEDPRWAGECFFTVAERLGAADQRWRALEACGQSGPFYDECLYHLWTGELGQVAEAADSAVDALEPARPIIAFWSGLRTIAGDPADQLWGDLWFFAHNAHRPADLADCAPLQPADRVRCEQGTRDFVLRALLGDLLAPGRPPDLLDRVCRSGRIPALWLDGLYVSEPTMDVQVDQAAALACDAAAGRPVRRWNPVFQARRPYGAPMTPRPGTPGTPGDNPHTELTSPITTDTQ